MSRSIVAAMVIALSMPLSLDAQQIGSVSLSLGWQRQVVLQRLAKYYDVDASGLVRSKKGPPREVLGSVGFEDGRLTSVSRNWDLSRGGAETGISAIVSALSQLEGDLSCRVETSKGSSPDNQMKAVKVYCGAHSVSITAGTREGGPTKPTVSEVWRVRAFSESRQRPPSGRGS